MKKPIGRSHIDERDYEIDSKQLRTLSRNTLKWKIDLRMVLGTLLIIGSIVSAYIISQSTTRMVTVWSAAIDLAPGEVIEESDIATTRVALSDKASMYLDGNIPIVGNYVVRPIKSSELIPTYSLTADFKNDLQTVPIALSSLRIPDGVDGGSVVDIYGVPRTSVAAFNAEEGRNLSKLLLANVSVDSINRESSKLGGDIGISILIPIEQVGSFMKSYSEFDFVLVKHR